ISSRHSNPTLSLHDALPISRRANRRSTTAKTSMCRLTFAAACPSINLSLLQPRIRRRRLVVVIPSCGFLEADFLSASEEIDRLRSEEHTSELQSLRHLVCRL